ncbi:hypothetical protein BRADI_4g13201v3 [Brachypodium distachyon]|uniref:Uncharacterized protein n=1 Tax=Brachypodium distachyon TaxID=15368 RepID=A0A0Q3H2Q9_BRADI|nr:hypothetical protein BRADI_4g13201v3 [Brachypodium distachyon]
MALACSMMAAAWSMAVAACSMTAAVCLRTAMAWSSLLLLPLFFFLFLTGACSSHGRPPLFPALARAPLSLCAGASRSPRRPAPPPRRRARRHHFAAPPPPPGRSARPPLSRAAHARPPPSSVAASPRRRPLRPLLPRRRSLSWPRRERRLFPGLARCLPLLRPPLRPTRVAPVRPTRAPPRRPPPCSALHARRPPAALPTSLLCLQPGGPSKPGSPTPKPDPSPGPCPLFLFLLFLKLLKT